MILQIDAGNTRVKWRVLDQSEVLESGASSFDDLVDELEQRFGSPNRVIDIHLASVASAENNALLLSKLRVAFPVARIYRADTASLIGLKLAYGDPSALGVDRALAMVAAIELAGQRGHVGKLLVLDAGSALTADWVDTDGCHFGGYIACGFEMMRRSLNQTGRIRVERFDEISMDPGASTAACVTAGVATLYIKAVESWLMQAKASAANVYLTGGDAQLIRSAFPDQVIHFEPDLVFEGLAISAVRASRGSA